VQALLLCFKLHESRTAVVSSTAAATLRQLVMFVVDKVVEEDRRMLLASELEPITLPDGTTRSLGPAARDTFAIFEDLCLLGNGESPQFLELEYLHKTFALELIESVLTNYHELFLKARVSFLRLPKSSYPCYIHSIPNYHSYCNIISARYSSRPSRNAQPSLLRSAEHASSFSCSNSSPLNSRQKPRSFSRCSSRSSVARLRPVRLGQVG
jgi:Guanine nucleotide exchange factor in Golgi transport N-terminal/Dimerisation and cyclophilin-binding domain of Mon2